LDEHKLVARDLMTARVESVGAQSRLEEAIAIMDRAGYGQIPVMEGTKPVGLLREVDIRRALIQGRQDRPVVEIASSLPRLVSPDTRLSDLLAAIHEQESLLVVEGDGALAGIITYWDLVVLARPFLMVTEVELMLRQATAMAYQKRYGPHWWSHVRQDLRQRAEEEHQQDRAEAPTPEHMLGHTSFWALIEIYRDVTPGEESWFEELHRIRVLRNRVAHHYAMSGTEEQELIRRCFKVRDWLQVRLKGE
jgi:CBS domain-containing protein